MAGVNAGLAALDRPPLVLSRADGFTGVMIDDLIVKGAEEPCMSYFGTFSCFHSSQQDIRSDVHFSVRISDEYSK